MSEESEFDKGKDFFTIGSSAKDCQIKVYFNDIRDDDVISKIDRAIELWGKATIKAKR
jgi:hypothetical protein